MSTPPKEIQLRGDSVLQLPFVPPRSLYGAKLGDLNDVDDSLPTDGAVVTRQSDGSFALEELPAGLGAPEWGDIVGTLASQTDLQTALDAKAATSHGHSTSDVTGLDAALAGKANTSHGHAIADTTGLQAALDAKAPLASPAFTGTPTVPTATGGTNTTQAASTAFVTAGLAGKANTSHSHAIADTTGLQAALDAKAPLASPAFTGTPTVPTATGGTNTTQAASTAFVTAGLAGKANTSHSHAIADTTGLQAALDAKSPLASPAFTGTPTVPTATGGTNTTQAASTAFVTAGLAGKANTSHSHAIADTTGLQAALDAIHPGFRTNYYYSSFNGYTAAARALVANRLFYTPFFVPRTTTFTRIGVNVSVLAASSTIRLGIYNNGNGVPSGAPLLDAGTVSGATTGEKEITISQTLTPGWYWLAVVSDGVPQLTADNNTTLGFRPNMGFATGAGGGYGILQEDITFGALPSVGTAIDGPLSAHPFRIWLRIV